ALRARGKAAPRLHLSFILLYDPVALPLARARRWPPPLRRPRNGGGGGVRRAGFGRPARSVAHPRTGPRSLAGGRARGPRDSGRLRRRARPAGARRSGQPRPPAPAELDPYGAAAPRVGATGRGRARGRGTRGTGRGPRATRVGPRARPPARSRSPGARGRLRRCSGGGGGL